MIKSVTSTLMALTTFTLFMGCNQDAGFFIDTSAESVTEERNDLPDPSTFIVSDGPDKLGHVTGGHENDGGGNPSDNDGDANPIVVHENFIQQANVYNKADILWVIDDSGSMNNIQTQLANSFESFIQDFILKDIDFQMRIVTTDVVGNKAGTKGNPILAPRFHQNSGIDCSQDLNKANADADSQKFIEDFKKCSKVGVQGSGHERGLEASALYAEKYPNWYREQAQKIIIYVSDEQDVSVETVPNYLDRLTDPLNSGIQIEKLTTYSITCTVPQPGSVCFQNQVGTRYMEMNDLTGGSFADMNQTPNFFDILGNLGAQIIELLNGHALSQVPVVASIEVRVNGQLVNPAHYEYRANSNSVFFLEQHLPQVDDEIKISYQKQ